METPKLGCKLYRKFVSGVCHFVVQNNFVPFQRWEKRETSVDTEVVPRVKYGSRESVLISQLEFQHGLNGKGVECKYSSIEKRKKKLK